MFNFQVRASLNLWCGGFLCPCIRTLLCSALLVLFALPGALSQTLPGALPDAEKSKSPYEAGLALVRSGYIDQAIDAFKKGLEIAPQDKVLLDATGAAYSMRGQLETARSYFNASLKVDPAFVPAKQNLGITLFALGRYAEAEDQFKSLDGQSERSRAIANLFLGMIAEKKSDCKTAVPELESAGALLYQYADAALSFGRCEYQIGNQQGAVQALSAFDQIPGQSSSQYEQAADLYMRLGQDRQALEELAKAREGKDQAAGIEKKRAELFEKTGQLNEAQSAWEAVVAAKPSADALVNLARVAKDRGDLDVAMKSLQRAAEIEPGREDIYLEFSSI